MTCAHAATLLQCCSICTQLLCHNSLTVVRSFVRSAKNKCEKKCGTLGIATIIHANRIIRIVPRCTQAFCRQRNAAKISQCSFCEHICRADHIFGLEFGWQWQTDMFGRMRLPIPFCSKQVTWPMHADSVGGQLLAAVNISYFRFTSLIARELDTQQRAVVSISSGDSGRLSVECVHHVRA